MFMILCSIIPYNDVIKHSTYIVKYRRCKGSICLCGTFPVVWGGWHALASYPVWVLLVPAVTKRRKSSVILSFPLSSCGSSSVCAVSAPLGSCRISQKPLGRFPRGCCCFLLVYFSSQPLGEVSGLWVIALSTQCSLCPVLGSHWSATSHINKLGSSKV